MRVLNRAPRLALVVLLAFGMGGVAQAHECAYDGWDMTSDGLLDLAEFRAGFDNEEWFDEWDDDDDELLSESEFDVGTSDRGLARTGLWADWDANGDDFIDDDEFAEGLFDAWDQDNDVMLSCDEYSAGREWFE